jgi:L-lactate dehydrogenase (cytochrome)
MPSLFPRALDRCFGPDDLRRLARRRLPRVIFEAIEAGADDEWTLAQNASAFRRLGLRPRALVDVGDVDASTTVLGTPVRFPVLPAPTALNRVYHADGELGVARAAAAAGTIYALSSAASTTIEDIARAIPSPKWFQVYVWRDRGVLRDFIQRCRAQGYDALCLTVDAPVLGHRERDLRNGMRLPPRPRPGGVLNAALHPRWVWGYLTGPRIGMANLGGGYGVPGHGFAELSRVINGQVDPGVTWKDLEWMLAEWNGPFVVKGIQHPEDARQAARLGVRAVIVSNHGGRQLDTVPAAIDVLPSIVDAVGGEVEILLDSGVRRGTDVLKAIALGARACLVGRPCLYGLAAGGEAGVRKALQLLEEEIRRGLALLGRTRLDQLDADAVQRIG